MCKFGRIKLHKIFIDLESGEKLVLDLDGEDIDDGSDEIKEAIEEFIKVGTLTKYVETVTEKELEKQGLNG